jgi:hypothetical protein
MDKYNADLLRAKLLAALRKEPRQVRTAIELASAIGADEKLVRNLIDVLRGEGHNVRNNRPAGFWLVDGPAPDATQQKRWKSKPPSTP